MSNCFCVRWHDAVSGKVGYQAFNHSLRESADVANRKDYKYAHLGITHSVVRMDVYYKSPQYLGTGNKSVIPPNA